VALEVSRDGKSMMVPVVLAEVADKPNELLPGVEVGKLSEDVRRHLGIEGRISGLIVTAVDEKSDYAEKLPVGTVIMEINRNPVDDLATAKALLRVGHNLILVQFRDIRRYLVVTKN
jgi:hypothetical protein